MTDMTTFDVSTGPGNVSIVLSSTMENIDRTDTLVKNLLHDQGLERHAFAVRVVLREGLTNSVRHGNKNNPEKLIRFNLKISKNTLTMTIEDQGEGFDWKSMQEECKIKSQSKTPSDHGRGVLIMTDYFDTYTYNQKGNKVILEKYISA